MSKSYVLEDRISALLQYVRGLPQQVRFERSGWTQDNPTPFDRIQYCSQAFLSGALPDAKTLEFVAVALNKYVTREGKISLDEAFGLKSKPKAGNPSRQASQRQRQINLLGRMAMIRGTAPKVTLEQAAGEALGEDDSFQVETLVRAYRRRGCKKWAEGWAKWKAEIESGK
ncbi:MAG: hypothetical protein MRJ68_11165 [Nitrospira sp.]|nr:hypothetical protein [Nitrospira sp.]